MIYSGFRRKERIFQFTPSVVHINDKNTGNKILDLPKSIINRVEKHITMKSEDNEEKPKLNHIIYDLEFEGKEMSFKYHTLNSNPLEESEALDQFLSQNYGVQVDIDQQFINKT